MVSKKSTCSEMDPAYLRFESEQFDETEEAEILTLLQSSDAESSSDDEPALPPNKKVSLDPSSGDSSVWKAAANLVNFMEGIGFLAIPYALKEGGVTAMVMFILIPIIMWYIGTVLTECLYDEDEQGNRHRARSGYKDLGDVLLPKYGGYIVSCIIQLDVFLIAVSYLVLFGSVMHHDLPSVPITERMWIGIAGGLVLPTVTFADCMVKCYQRDGLNCSCGVCFVVRSREHERVGPANHTDLGHRRCGYIFVNFTVQLRCLPNNSICRGKYGR